MTAEKERGRFAKWAPSALRSKPIVEVTTAALEGFVELLDRSVQDDALAWKSAANIWGIVRSGFEDAARSKTRALRVLPSNPAVGVRGPTVARAGARHSMSPTTFLRLVARPDVPVQWRVAVALAVYTGLRAAELRGLTWADVDLEHGFLLVHRTLDDDGEAGSTKTEKPRRVPIEPALAPLLRQLREGRSPGDAVMELPARHMSRGLRTWLHNADLGGSELQTSATSAALTWHDLRATWITWRAIRGDAPIEIMVGAGHDDFATTQRYIRRRSAPPRVWRGLPRSCPRCCR
ncbi:MAG: site-specific integrase [Polyangiaceae bacterium]|nr:site-specific integrase [Polyangiaceae bacterium]